MTLLQAFVTGVFIGVVLGLLQMAMGGGGQEEE